jgi:DNA-binding transcriptional MerR regulator
MPEDERYSLTDLADVSGVTPRTVRYYISQGLLPAVGPSGPGAKYDASHLARLRLIRRLQAEHLPLAEIRRRMDQLSAEEIRDLSDEGAPRPPSDSALDYLRTVLGESAEPRIPVRRHAASPMHLHSTRDPSPEPSAGSDEPGTRPANRSQWDRIVLTPDLELHVRRPLDRAQIKQVDRLVTIARELLEEDRS